VNLCRTPVVAIVVAALSPSWPFRLFCGAVKVLISPGASLPLLFFPNKGCLGILGGKVR